VDWSATGAISRRGQFGLIYPGLAEKATSGNFYDSMIRILIMGGFTVETRLPAPRPHRYRTV
jgi:hypothetical protein